MRHRIKNKSIASDIKGLFTPSIPYEVRLKSGDWSEYFGNYQNQKWGRWDSDSCWALSGINCIEDQLEWLNKNNQFDAEVVKFFTDNGYIDADGDFSLSERYIEILGKRRDQGGNSTIFGDLVKQYGLIPRSMLTYTADQANRWQSQAGFDEDYFDIDKVTQAMKDLGQQFKKYVQFKQDPVGKIWVTPDPKLIMGMLFQSPLQISIPVPQDGMWNFPKVKYNGRTVLDHLVELYKYDAVSDSQYPYFIFDQYEPHLKQLSKDYFVAMVTNSYVEAIKRASPNPVVQGLWQKVWAAVIEWFTRNSQGILGGILKPKPVV